MIENIIDKINNIHDICNKYTDVLEDKSSDIDKEIGNSKKLEEQFREISENNRLLRIGIVGRVKAGKSTLLNSVFFAGEDILPKAATPMTASLTVLKYGSGCSAKVDFFNVDDIKKIAIESHKYKQLLEEECKREKEKDTTRSIKAKIGIGDNDDKYMRKAMRNLKEKSENLTASYLQYEDMKRSGLLDKFSAGVQPETLNAENMKNLAERLKDYVGANGKYMPFTKSVDIELPERSLKDIAVVDTPGLNDPIESRSRRTQEYLANCDVVFIVSPAGQFMSKADMELMDMLTEKKGVRELYAVASQADNQLFGSDSEEFGRDLYKAIDYVKGELTESLHGNIIDLNETYPDTRGQFAQLLENDANRLIFTSGICYSLAKRYDDQESWDGSMRHAYNNLYEHFPDYFDSEESAKVNLNMLSGINSIEAAISRVKEKKKIILHQKQDDILNAWEKSIDKYYKNLIEEIHGTISVLEKSDIEKNEKEHAELEQLKKTLSEDINYEFHIYSTHFINDLRNKINDEQKRCFKETDSEIENAHGTKKERHSYKSGGFFGLFQDTNYYTETVETIRCGAVKNQLNRLYYDLEAIFTRIISNSKEEWLKKMPMEIGKVVKKNIDNATYNFQTDDLLRALRKQANNLRMPNINFSGCRFENSESGTKSGRQMEDYLNKVQDYLANLRQYFHDQTKIFLDNLENAINMFNLSEEIFTSLNQRLNKVGELVKNKKISLQRLNTCLKELQEIEQ